MIKIISLVLKRLFSCAVVVCACLFALQAQQPQKGNYKPAVYLDKLQGIQIDQLVFYQDPLFIEGEKLTDDYVPEWYPAYCANGRFDYFKDFARDAVKYFHSKSNITEEQLVNHLEMARAKGWLSPEMNLNKYEYIYGEIWFTYQKTNEKIGLVMGYIPPEKIGSYNFGDIYSDKKAESLFPFKNMFTSHDQYIYEDKILKRANLNYVFYDILKTDSVNFEGTTFETFTVLLKNAPIYTRSRLENGHRIFETVKNTPNGPVVVGNEPWYLKYWWAWAAGLVTIVLLVLFVRLKSKKQ